MLHASRCSLVRKLLNLKAKRLRNTRKQIQLLIFSTETSNAAIKNDANLLICPWFGCCRFAGPIERFQAEAELINRVNSTYLVRHRSKEFSEYAISIK